MTLQRKIFKTLGLVALISAGSWFLTNKPVQASVENATPVVTITQAIETVLAANPDVTITSVNLERENNKLVWEVELDNDLEVYVDANNRKIIKTEGGWNLADLNFLID